MTELTPVAAAEALHAGRLRQPTRVPGRIDLNHYERESLPAGLHCYELDARGSRLTSLPADLRVDGRLVLDGSNALASLPEGLTAGSISLRNCASLRALPEKLSTWFLDLTGCAQFEEWPRQATIHHGSLILRNCTSVRSLPSWLGRLANLDLAGCILLAEIPEGITVSSWVDVGGTRLRGLPPSLQGASLRWRGVSIDARMAFEPEKLAARDALQERNAERRRVIIERMGYLRFVNEAGARVLDEDQDPGGTRKLVTIALDGDEPLVGLFCCCPSTGRQYLLRVPPTMKSCHQAAAWVAGFDDPKLYRPQHET